MRIDQREIKEEIIEEVIKEFVKIGVSGDEIVCSLNPSHEIASTFIPDISRN